MNWIDAYPYLSTSLILVSVAAASLLLIPRHRTSLLLSGVLSVPSATASFLFIPEYWEPKVLGHFILSFEDVLFSGAIGTTTWFLAIAPFAKHIRTNITHCRVLLRFGLCYSIGFMSFGVLTLTLPSEFTIMSRMLLSMLAVAAFLLFLRKDMVHLALFGAWGCTVFHGVCMGLVIQIWPDMRGYWNPAAQLPFVVAGIPAFELLWALTYGFTWPLLISFVLDVRWRSSGTSCRNSKAIHHESIRQRFIESSSAVHDRLARADQHRGDRRHANGL